MRLPGHGTPEDEVGEELRFHIEGRVRELVDAGWDEEEARLEVMRRFGDLARVEADCRTYRRQRRAREERMSKLGSLISDARFAARSVRRRPGFTALVVGTLGLAMGAVAAVFGVVDAVLLTPLPFPDTDELVVVWETDRASGTTREPASVPDYYDFRERSRTLESVGIYATFTAALTRPDGDPLSVDVTGVSAGLFDVLGASVALGRALRPEDDAPGGPASAVLSHRLWRDEFGRDPGVVGRTVSIDEEPVTVLGVLPEGVGFPDDRSDLWMSLNQGPTTAERSRHWVTVLGRLADGVSMAEARTELDGVAAELEATYPANQNRGVFLEALEEVRRGDVRTTLWVLLGAVLALLAIAVVNVTNLNLARNLARGRDLAVHRALGAGAARLTRRFAFEGILLAILATGAGLVLARIGLRTLLSVAPAELARLGDFAIDGPVLTLAALLAAAQAIVLAIVPVAAVRGTDVRESLQAGGRGATGGSLGVRRILVAAQVGLAVALLIGTGLLVRTVRNLGSVDLGFHTEHLVRATVNVPASRYPTDFSVWPDWPERRELQAGVLQAIREQPGVRSAALVTSHPLSAGFTNSFSLSDRPYDPEQGEISVRMVTSGYLKTAGVEVLEGRRFRPGDGGSPHLVALINRAAADRLFPEGGALGTRIGIWGGRQFEIVGIVENERFRGVKEEAHWAMYVDLAQVPTTGDVSILAEVEPGVESTAGSLVRRAVWSVDPGLAVYDVTTMEATFETAIARERFLSAALGGFSLVAAVLALLGIHGVLSYLVSQRTREVGVRMALGASRRTVVALVLRQGMGMIVLGIALGVTVAATAGRALEALLFGVTPTEPIAYAAVVLGLGTTALLASALPAVRAAGIDPIESLKSE